MEETVRLRITAHHEAAHAVVALVLGCPPLKKITTVGETGLGNRGHCEHEPRPDIDSHPALDAVAQLLFELHARRRQGGPVDAEITAANEEFARLHAEINPPSAGERREIYRAQIATDICVFLAGGWGGWKLTGTYDLMGTSDDRDWARDKTQDLTRDKNERQSIYDRENERAKALVEEHWHTIETLAAALLEHLELDGPTAEAIIRKALI
jgi:ATP-dependent Zn protease